MERFGLWSFTLGHFGHLHSGIYCHRNTRDTSPGTFLRESWKRDILVLGHFGCGAFWLRNRLVLGHQDAFVTGQMGTSRGLRRHRSGTPWTGTDSVLGPTSIISHVVVRYQWDTGWRGLKHYQLIPITCPDCGAGGSFARLSRRVKTRRVYLKIN